MSLPTAAVLHPGAQQPLVSLTRTCTASCSHAGVPISDPLSVQKLSCRVHASLLACGEELLGVLLPQPVDDLALPVASEDGMGHPSRVSRTL